MRIERHIFGSKDGYRTLAHSAGLSATECKSLEGFAFGTPYDPALRASLAKNPAYWSRPVGRDKRAITRIMLGQPDDAGRPTLVFISVVISAGDWDTVLQGDAGPLLRMADLWRWNPSTPLEPSQSISPHPSALRLNDQSIQRVLGLVSLLEQAWSFRKPVMIREGAYSFEEILTVERLLPPPIRRTYSSVYRGIIADMPVTLNCLARSVQANSGNPFRSLAGAVSPYAKSLAREGLLEGRIPSSLVHRYSHFSKPVVEAIDDGAGSEDMIKVPHLPKVRAGPNLSAVTLAVAAAALILGFLIGWLANRPPPN
ncbi:MAG: hypothetical protein ACE5EQ_09035, partial [Phycisphaerae bacterium]